MTYANLSFIKAFEALDNYKLQKGLEVLKEVFPLASNLDVLEQAIHNIGPNLCKPINLSEASYKDLLKLKKKILSIDPDKVIKTKTLSTWRRVLGACFEKCRSENDTLESKYKAKAEKKKANILQAKRTIQGLEVGSLKEIFNSIDHEISPNPIDVKEKAKLERLKKLISKIDKNKLKPKQVSIFRKIFQSDVAASKEQTYRNKQMQMQQDLTELNQNGVDMIDGLKSTIDTKLGRIKTPLRTLQTVQNQLLALTHHIRQSLDSEADNILFSQVDLPRAADLTDLQSYKVRLTSKCKEQTQNANIKRLHYGQLTDIFKIDFNKIDNLRSAITHLETQIQGLQMAIVPNDDEKIHLNERKRFLIEEINQLQSNLIPFNQLRRDRPLTHQEEERLSTLNNLLDLKEIELDQLNSILDPVKTLKDKTSVLRDKKLEFNSLEAKLHKVEGELKKIVLSFNESTNVEKSLLLANEQLIRLFKAYQKEGILTADTETTLTILLMTTALQYPDTIYRILTAYFPEERKVAPDTVVNFHSKCMDALKVINHEVKNIV